MSKKFSQDNMTSILTKLKGEFDDAKSQDVSVTLLASAWSNRKQTIAVAGLGEKQNGVICLSQDISVTEYDAAAAAGLFVSGQASGELVIGYTGDTPTCDIPATIILLN